jgi:hypothetical protein
MRIRNKLAVAVVSLLGVFGVMEAAAPAYASINDCSSGNICLYDANNFGLTGYGVWQWSVGYIYGLSGHCLNLSSTPPNNMASSYADKSVGGESGFYTYIYVANNCSGLARSYQSPLGDTNLADNLVLPVGMNNSISSIRVTDNL